MKTPNDTNSNSKDTFKHKENQSLEKQTDLINSYIEESPKPISLNSSPKDQLDCLQFLIMELSPLTI